MVKMRKILIGFENVEVRQIDKDSKSVRNKSLIGVEENGK